MESSRRWNVQRHIRNKHEGKGDVIGKMPYIIKTLKQELPFPTYPANMRPEWLVNSHLLSIIDTHTEQVFENFVNSIKVKMSGFKHRVCGRVCKDCLNIVFDISASLWGRSIDYPRPDHHCDPGWLLQYRSLSHEEKRLAVKHLESKIPSLLMALLRKNNLTGSWFITAIEERKTLKVQREVYMMLLNVPNLDQAGRLSVNIRLRMLQDKETQLDTAYLPMMIEEYEWVAKAIQSHFVEINDDKLFQFLNIAKSNQARFKVEARDGPARYFLFSAA